MAPLPHHHCYYEGNGWPDSLRASLYIAQPHEYLEAGHLDLLTNTKDFYKSRRHMGGHHSSQFCCRAVGQFTLSIGEGELKALTAYYGIIHSLPQHMWGRAGWTTSSKRMRTSRSSHLASNAFISGLNRMIIYQPRGENPDRAQQGRHARLSVEPAAGEGAGGAVPTMPGQETG